VSGVSAAASCDTSARRRSYSSAEAGHPTLGEPATQTAPGVGKCSIKRHVSVRGAPATSDRHAFDGDRDHALASSAGPFDGSYKGAGDVFVASLAAHDDEDG